MKKILIIDGEQNARRVLMKALVEVGYVVREASDEKRAFNTIVREEIDLVLLAIRLPVIDGNTMLEVLREFDPGFKVIMTSGYSTVKQMKVVPGATGYYDKSEGIRTLLGKVKVALDEEVPTRPLAPNSHSLATKFS